MGKGEPQTFAVDVVEGLEDWKVHMVLANLMRVGGGSRHSHHRCQPSVSGRQGQGQQQPAYLK